MNKPKGMPTNGMEGFGFCDNWLNTPASLIFTLSTIIVFSVSKYFPSGTRFTASQEKNKLINTINSDIFVRSRFKSVCLFKFKNTIFWSAKVKQN